MKIRLMHWDAGGTRGIVRGKIAIHEDNGDYYELELDRATLSAFLNDDGSLKGGINTTAIRTALRSALPAYRSLGTG